MTIKTAIARLIEFEPSLSNSDIARTLSVSRQLVSYHTKRMRLKRGSIPRGCAGCQRRIKTGNHTRLCRTCILESYAYEFVCAECGRTNVVYGVEASNRRSNNRRYKTARADGSYTDHCNRSCAAKRTSRIYWALRQVDQA
jgi:predicted amidophosphoribosyltransferase